MAVEIVGEAFIRIRPTATGFEAELVKEVKGAVARVEKIGTIKPKVDTSAATGPLDVLKKRIEEFAGKNNVAIRTLGELETAAGGASGALGGLAAGGLALAAAAVTAFAIKGVFAFQNFANQARAVQRATGLSAEEASGLAAVFRATGVEIGTAARAFLILSRNATLQRDALKDLGVTIAQTTTGQLNVRETLLRVSDAYNATTDQSRRALLAQTAFGRGAISLLPILERGRDGLAQLFDEAQTHGLIFDQAQLEQAREFGLAMHSLREAAEGLFVSVGTKLVPILTPLVQRLEELVNLLGDTSDKAVEGRRGLADFTIAGVRLGAAAQGISNSLDDWFLAQFGVSSSTADLVRSQLDAQRAADDATKAADRQTAALEEQDAVLAELAKKVDAIQQSNIATLQAERAVTSAIQSRDQASVSLARAQRELAELQAKGAVDAKKVAEAQREVARTTRAAADAAEALTRAQQEEADVQRKLDDLISGGAAMKALAADSLSAERAILGVTSAQRGLADANERLADLLNPKPASARDTERARIAVTQGERRLIDLAREGTASAEDQRSAELDLADARDRLAELTDPIPATEQEIAVARSEVEQATLAQKEAEKTLGDARERTNELGRIGAENSVETIALRDDLRGKTDAVKNAEQGLADATENHAVAQGHLKEAQAGDPEFLDKIRDLTDRVAGARSSLNTATDALAASQFALADAQRQEFAVVRKEGPEAVDALMARYQSLLKLKPELSSFLTPLIADLRILQGIPALDVLRGDLRAETRLLPPSNGTGSIVVNSPITINAAGLTPEQVGQLALDTMQSVVQSAVRRAGG